MVPSTALSLRAVYRRSDDVVIKMTIETIELLERVLLDD
jgi:hypothetical protein